MEMHPPHLDIRRSTFAAGAFLLTAKQILIAMEGYTFGG